MRILLMLGIILSCFISTKAQIVNTLSKDKSGFYTHALDSCISIWKEANNISKIYLLAEGHVLDALPDSLQGIPLLRPNSGQSKKKRKHYKLRDDELSVKITPLSVIRDEIKLGVFSKLEDQLYMFYYYYHPATKDYYLKKIRAGLKL